MLANPREIICRVAVRPICLRKKEDVDSWRRRMLDRDAEGACGDGQRE
jgi:hypothetical protein